MGSDMTSHPRYDAFTYPRGRAQRIEGQAAMLIKNKTIFTQNDEQDDNANNVYLRKCKTGVKNAFSHGDCHISPTGGRQ